MLFQAQLIIHLQMVKAFRQILMMYCIFQKGANMLWIFYLNLMKSSLYKIYALVLQNDFAPYVSQTKQHTLNEVIKIIADNFSDPDLSVSELSSISQMGEGHFRRLFKSIYNTTPIQYIKTIRFNYAKTLLELHNHTIDEIVKLSGFANTYYFSKCFKAETEMALSQYKAAHNSIS